MYSRPFQLVPDCLWGQQPPRQDALKKSHLPHSHILCAMFKSDPKHPFPSSQTSTPLLNNPFLHPIEPPSHPPQTNPPPAPQKK